MRKEYEAKFLDIDYKKCIKKLKELGAKRVHKNKMFRRKVYVLCDTSVRGFARVRDEGGAVTMTSKVYIDPKFPDETEIEITGSFEGLKTAFKDGELRLVVLPVLGFSTSCSSHIPAKNSSIRFRIGIRNCSTVRINSFPSSSSITVHMTAHGPRISTIPSTE